MPYQLLLPVELALRNPLLAPIDEILAVSIRLQ